MRKISLILALILVNSFVIASDFQHNLDISDAQEQEIIELVDVNFDRFISNIAVEEYEDTLNPITSKIDSYLTMPYSDEIKFALSYLQRRIEDTIEGSEEEHIPESIEKIDIGLYYDGDKSITAGQESIPVIELTYTARLEDIVIQDLEFSSNYDISQIIQVVHIYDENGIMLSEFSPFGTNHTIHNINLYIPKGTSKFYVTLSPHKIGNRYVGDQINDLVLNFKIAKAIGQTNNEKINSNRQLQSSDQIDILPVRIRDIQLVDDALGYSVDTKLFNGENNLAIIAIQADTRDNTSSSSYKNLGILLQEITLDVEDNLSNNYNNASIRRLDRGDQNVIYPSINSGSQLTFDFDSAPLLDKLIDNGETAYYLITADINPDNTNTESIRISLKNLNQGAIVYRSDDTNSQSIDQLNFEYEYINGTRITE